MMTGRCRASGAMLRAECDLALDRLLDEERRRTELLQPRLGLHRAPQLDGGLDVVVLLVAVERDVERAGDRVEDAGDLYQALDVGLPVAAHLELESALAVRGDHFVERLGQAVVDPRAGRLVAGDDRVEQADRVPRLDAAHRLEAGEKGGEVEAGRGRE